MGGVFEEIPLDTSTIVGNDSTSEHAGLRRGSRLSIPLPCVAEILVYLRV